MATNEHVLVKIARTILSSIKPSRPDTSPRAGRPTLALDLDKPRHGIWVKLLEDEYQYLNEITKQLRSLSGIKAISTRHVATLILQHAIRQYRNEITPEEVAHSVIKTT